MIWKRSWPKPLITWAIQDKRRQTLITAGATHCFTQDQGFSRCCKSVDCVTTIELLKQYNWKHIKITNRSRTDSNETTHYCL